MRRSVFSALGRALYLEASQSSLMPCSATSTSRCSSGWTRPPGSVSVTIVKVRSRMNESKAMLVGNSLDYASGTPRATSGKVVASHRWSRLRAPATNALCVARPTVQRYRRVGTRAKAKDACWRKSMKSQDATDLREGTVGPFSTNPAQA